ncbi:DNA ligase 1-like [Pogonomyrmex barbatus]|uniref:DNA ligase 1-like n=1 Tax=Pogonomyrmex barbatus TaxID=144034 RepID=A0A6I9WGE5_9HYME|nr:DNA ligase 1-like [Pogonomyrmex barbatus]
MQLDTEENVSGHIQNLLSHLHNDTERTSKSRSRGGNQILPAQENLEEEEEEEQEQETPDEEREEEEVREGQVEEETEEEKEEEREQARGGGRRGSKTESSGHKIGKVVMEKTLARVDRERSDSLEKSLEEQMKRKREVLGNDSVDEAEIFKRSKKLGRLPIGKGWNEELKELVRELKEEVKEGLKEVKEEIKEIADAQKEAVRIEVEKMKENLKMREKRWNKEREELKEKIEKMEWELEGLKIERIEEGRGKEREESEERLLAERLREEVEEKRLIPEVDTTNQIGGD